MIEVLPKTRWFLVGKDWVKIAYLETVGNEARTWLKMAFLFDSKEIKLILYKHLLSIYNVTGIVLKHVVNVLCWD